MKNEEFKGLLGMGLWPVRKKAYRLARGSEYNLIYFWQKTNKKILICNYRRCHLF